MAHAQLSMTHLDLFVYQDDLQPHFGIAIPENVTGNRSKEVSTFGNTLIDTADGKLSILMGFLLEISERHISFQAKHDGRDITCYKFALASHCKNPYLNRFLTRYLEKVAEIEKNQ